MLQDYYDLAKLWRRCEVKEGGSSIVSRLAPPIFLGSFILLAAGLPLVTQACPVPILGDIITILYLMALPRFMFALASIDSAGSYTAIGGVRELLVGVLVEPRSYWCSLSWPWPRARPTWGLWPHRWPI